MLLLRQEGKKRHIFKVQLIMTPLSSTIIFAFQVILPLSRCYATIYQRGKLFYFPFLAKYITFRSDCFHIDGSFFNANELNESHSSVKYYKYGSCTFSEKLTLSRNIHIVLSLLIVLLTFGIQITLFFKQRKLKNEQALGIMVVTYNNDGVNNFQKECKSIVGP